MDMGNNSTASASYSCWEITLQIATAQNSTEFVSPFLPPLQVAFACFLLVFGLALNGFVLLLVLRYKELHRREFALVLQVVVADLASVCIYPFVIATRLNGLWEGIGPSWCSLLGFTRVLFLNARYTSMLLLSVDRFSMVILPFSYPARGNKVISLLAAVKWLILLTFAAAPLPQCYGYQASTGFCGLNTLCAPICSAWRYITDVVIFAIGAVVPIVLYSFMFWKAAALRKRTKINGCGDSSDDSERRARITYLLLFITLVVSCALPSLGFLMLTSLKTKNPVVYWTYHGIASNILFLVVVLDPLVILRHQDVKYCALELLKNLSIFRRK